VDNTVRPHRQARAHSLHRPHRRPAGPALTLPVARCFHEHLDIFTEVEKPETQPLIETPFGGRFCGQNAPRERISLYQSLSMVFLSDRWPSLSSLTPCMEE
jgi:hypothetical protein